VFIFDTDIYTNVLRKIPSKKLIDRLKKVPRRDQFTTAITIGEVFYGIMKSPNRLRLLELFETVLLPRATILPFDFLAARKYGEVRTLLEKQGTPLEQADSQIASIALSRNMTLITGNIRHFKRVPGLKVENWL